jgi:predicted TPR repeat methyltransferase
VRRFEQAIAADPRYAPAQYLLGNVRASARDWPAAERAYRGHLELDPQGAEAAEARHRLEFVRAQRGRRR